MDMNRRSLITGLISLVAAPAIVRVSSVMTVKQMYADGGWFDPFLWKPRTAYSIGDIIHFGGDRYHMCISAGVSGTLEKQWQVGSVVFSPLNTGRPTWVR